MENPSIRPYLVNRTKLNKIAKKKWKELAMTVNAAVLNLKRRQTTRIALVPL
jgi:hypothetical protein